MRAAVGAVLALVLAVALQARELRAQVLESLADEQVIVTQNLAGGYEVDYADADDGAFERTRGQLDGLSPVVRLRIANDDVLKHLYLDGLTELEHLELANNNSLRSINGLDDLKRLQTLEISNNFRLKNEIEPFTALSELRTLKVVGNYRLRVLPDLNPLTALRELEIVNNERLAALSGLESLHELERLEVRGNGRLANRKSVV